MISSLRTKVSVWTKALFRMLLKLRKYGWHCGHSWMGNSTKRIARTDDNTSVSIVDNRVLIKQDNMSVHVKLIGIILESSLIFFSKMSKFYPRALNISK